MANVTILGVHVVEVRDDKQDAHLWVAVTSHDKAVATVQAELPAGWKAITVTGRQLTQEQIAAMKLRPGEVREMTS